MKLHHLVKTVKLDKQWIAKMDAVNNVKIIHILIPLTVNAFLVNYYVLLI